MERIVALVEGHMETHFVRSTYANAIVQRPFPNGRDVALEIIVECIIDALETVGGGIYRIIILLDREQRTLESCDIAAFILSSVRSAFPTRRFFVGVADRQIENWIVADEEFVRNRFGLASYTYAGDGTYGKGVLDTLCGNDLRGPKDKALMLKACSATRSAQGSQSLRAFVSSIDFGWRWASG